MWTLRSKLQEDELHDTHSRIQPLSNVRPIQIVFCYDSYAHDRFHKSPNFDPVLNYTIPNHTFTTYFF
jgi:hypothetical protein